MSRGSNVFGQIRQVPSIIPTIPPHTNDIFLHALFARLTLSNNDTVEFQTHFDEKTNTIELYIPSEALNMLNQLTGIQRGPRFKTFINWLIGSRELVPARDLNFIPASDLQVWFGAMPTVVDEGRLVLNLPTKEASAVGYNSKTDDKFNGDVKISLIWVYICGSNTSFNIRASTTVSDALGDTPVITSMDSSISTFNLLPGDIRETEILSISNVGNNNIINTLINRNYLNSSEPQTDSVGVIGLRISLVDYG